MANSHMTRSLVARDCGRPVPSPSIDASVQGPRTDEKELATGCRRRGDIAGPWGRPGRGPDGGHHETRSDSRFGVTDADHRRCGPERSEEHTSELQSLTNLVCR